MSIIVQKYGGSSVATEDKLRHVAGKIVAAKRAGHDVVAVVSAMGSTTNDLLDLARHLADDPSRRELDMLLSSGERISMSLLSMAIQDLGEDAISLTGPQSGIHTTDRHYNARIVDVEPERVHEELARGRIVVVAGFQGENPRGETTTLGRGGSDTTAVALAAAIGADRCEIYSDVDGIYSADPRIVDGANRLQEISYEEMQELARHGAKVLAPRAVNYAWKHDVTIHARSTFSEQGGTVIHSFDEKDDPEVIGVACHRDLIRVAFNEGRESSLADEVLEAVGKADLYMDEQDARSRRRDLLVSAENIADVTAFANRLDQEFGKHLDIATELGSVSAVGFGVGTADQAMDRVHAYMQDFDANLRSSYHTEHALTCVVDADHVGETMRGFHKQFVESGFGVRKVA